MRTKDKPGVENWEKLAVCKIDGNELKYEEGGKNVGLKQYLTRLGIKFENLLDHYDIVDNPYKDLPRCHCMICKKVFKDEGNKSGMLTSHITKSHKVDIKEYLEQYPNQSHLFNTPLLLMGKQKFLGESPDNRIQCPICMKYFKAIKGSHTKLHEMTPTEFREFTGMKTLLSKKSEDVSREVYYSDVGLINYKNPKRTPEKVKKEKIPFKQKELKVFKEGVDYYTYDYGTLITEGKHFIYKITSPSGKCYIGRTNDFYHRMAKHKNITENPSCKGIYSAIQKYGWNNMKLEVIDIANNKLEAIEKELRWINFFDSYKNGYNNTLKTESGGCMIDKDLDPEGYALYIEKLSKRSKGKTPHNKGIPFSEEVKQKMKEKAKGRYSLDWFIQRHGEEEGNIKYQERVTKLANRTDHTRDEKGNFIKKITG